VPLIACSIVEKPEYDIAKSIEVAAAAAAAVYTVWPQTKRFACPVRNY